MLAILNTSRKTPPTKTLRTHENQARECTLRHFGFILDPFCFRIGAFFVTISSASLFCEIHTAPTREQGFRDSDLSKINSFLNVDSLIYRAVSGPPSQTSLLSILCWLGAKSKDFRVPFRTQWVQNVALGPSRTPLGRSLAALELFLDPPWTLILSILGNSWAFLDRFWPPSEDQTNFWGRVGFILAPLLPHVCFFLRAT